jgi:hypothetical protein
MVEGSGSSNAKTAEVVEGMRLSVRDRELYLSTALSRAVSVSIGDIVCLEYRNAVVSLFSACHKMFCKG